MMKVYIVFYVTYLGDDAMCDVFASQQAAQAWVNEQVQNNQGIEFKIEEWDVRG